MHVFVTGASGFVGSAIVQQLLSGGHTVLGLARSDASAAALAAQGVAVQRGDLNDLASLRAGAAASDGVIHTAFVHDFSQMAAAGQTDLAAIGAMGDVLAGSNRPLIVTSGTAHLKQGQVADEAQAPDAGAGARHRIPSEEATLALAARGVRAMLLRLPPSVHGDGDHGFVPAYIAAARTKGVAAYIGDGQNRWSGVHRLDAARAYRLALESGQAGARYHATDEQGVPVRAIAEVVGRRLGLPVASIPAEEALAHFGWLGRFLAMDCPVSSAWTRAQLGWQPTQPGLLADLDGPAYYPLAT